jgi:hypothetical protein
MELHWLDDLKERPFRQRIGCGPFGPNDDLGYACALWSCGGNQLYEVSKPTSGLDAARVNPNDDRSFGIRVGHEVAEV